MNKGFQQLKPFMLFWGGKYILMWVKMSVHFKEYFHQKNHAKLKYCANQHDRIIRHPL